MFDSCSGTEQGEPVCVGILLSLNRVIRSLGEICSSCLSDYYCQLWSNCLHRTVAYISLLSKVSLYGYAITATAMPHATLHHCTTMLWARQATTIIHYILLVIAIVYPCRPESSRKCQVSMPSVCPIRSCIDLLLNSSQFADHTLT